MGSPFFPGATPFAQHRRRNRCLWREEALMLHLLQETINPPLHLRACLRNWDAISLDLREPHRTRTVQANQIEQRMEELTALLS